jgi:hypothetical protein
MIDTVPPLRQARMAWRSVIPRSVCILWAFLL